MRSRKARRFRYGLIIFDAATIVYFIFTAAVVQTPLLQAINIALGALILADLLARLWVSSNPWRDLRRIYTLADILVIGTLLVAPLFTVATLTTTGFGDITMKMPGGQLLTVLIMVVGMALFIQLARAIFQPSKVHYKCSDCGLSVA